MAQSLKAVGRETLETLQGVKTLMGSLTAAVGDLNNALAGMSKPIDEGGKSLKRWGDSLHDVVDTTEEGIDNYKEILNLTTKLHRVGISDQKEREKAQKYLKELSSEYEKAKKFHEGDVAKLKEISKVTNAINKAMAVGADSAEEFAAAVGEVSNNAKEVKGTLGNLSLERLTASTHRLGKSLDEGIGGALKGLKLLDNFGFKGLFGNLANMQMRIKQIKDETQKSGQARASQHSRAVGNAYEDITSGNAIRREGGISQLGGLYKNSETPEARAGLVRQLSGKTGVMGILDRQLGKRALASAGSGSMGLMGKAGMGLMEAGGGSVLGGAAMQMAGPAAAIYGLLQLFQQGFDRNKDIYSKFGKGGIVQGGGRMGENYNAWSQAMEPGGFGTGGQGKGAARYYDLDFEKMTDMIKIVVESGQALQTNYGKINQGMTPDQALVAPRASNIYSGVVRNGAMFGKNIGLDATESTQLTMKLMHEFSLSMGEVEDMFVHIGKAVQSTGISTVAYLKLIDDVTGEFDKLNKSLNFTCGLMLLLGKNATYTTDDISKMVKGLEGDKKTYEQSIFAYERMGEKGRLGFAKSMQATYQATGAKLIGEGKIKDTNELESISDEELRNRVTPGHPEETAEMERFIKERKKGKGAMKDHSALALATQEATTGETLQGKIAKQLSLLKVAMPEGTKLSDFMGTTAGASNRVQSLEKSPEFLKVAEHLNIHPENLTTQLGQAGHQILAGIKEASQMNPATEEGKAARAQFSSIGPKEWESIAKNVKAGKDITEMKPVQAVFNDLAAQRLADNITEAETKAAKDTAEENQRYITGPLDYIQKALKALVEHIITLLETVVNFVNRYFFKTDMQTLADQKTSAEDYAQKELPMEMGPLKKFEEAAEKATGEDKKRLTDVVSTIKQAQGLASDKHTGTNELSALRRDISSVLNSNPLSQDDASSMHVVDLKSSVQAALTSHEATAKMEKGHSSVDVAEWDPNDANLPSRQKLLEAIALQESGGGPDEKVYNMPTKVKNKNGKLASSAWGKYQQTLPTAKGIADTYLGGFNEDLWRGRKGYSPQQAVAYQTQIQGKNLDITEASPEYKEGVHKTAFELLSLAEGLTGAKKVVQSAKDTGIDFLKKAATDPTIIAHGNLPGLRKELSMLHPGNSYTTILSADASVNTDGAVTVPSHAGEQAPLRGDGQTVYETGKGGKI
jgi:hypothetical protein